AAPATCPRSPVRTSHRSRPARTLFLAGVDVGCAVEGPVHVPTGHGGAVPRQRGEPGQRGAGTEGSRGRGEQVASRAVSDQDRAPIADLYDAFPPPGPRLLPFMIPGHKLRTDLVGSVVAGDLSLWGHLAPMRDAAHVLADAEALAGDLWG